MYNISGSNIDNTNDIDSDPINIDNNNGSIIVTKCGNTYVTKNSDPNNVTNINGNNISPTIIVNIIDPNNISNDMCGMAHTRCKNDDPAGDTTLSCSENHHENTDT